MLVLATKFSMRLKDNRHAITAVYDNPDGIQTAFAVAVSRAPAWAQGPRRVAELVQNVDLMVGMDKSWLRGTVTPKQVNVDEWLITQFDVSDDALDLMLRKKLTEKESLFFHLRRSEMGVSGVVEHPGHPGGEAMPGNLTPQDMAQLDRIWNALKIALREMVDQKEQLLAVSLDAQPVLEGGLVIPFIVRLIAMFAPTVREIAKRSPNEFELSLKMESDAGRREEVYLRKEQLISSLQPLTAAGRQIFAPLGLDTWLPGVTNPPPQVAPVPGSNIPPALSSTRRIQGE